jgi:hypothetical protein
VHWERWRGESDGQREGNSTEGLEKGVMEQTASPRTFQSSNLPRGRAYSKYNRFTIEEMLIFQ